MATKLNDTSRQDDETNAVRVSSDREDNDTRIIGEDPRPSGSDNKIIDSIAKSDRMLDLHANPSLLESIELEVAKLDQLEYTFGQLIRLYFKMKGRNAKDDSRTILSSANFDHIFSYDFRPEIDFLIKKIFESYSP